MNAANKAWYWVAAGVLALGLNGYYQDGGFQGLHRLAECSTRAYAETRAQLQQAATLAEVAFAQHSIARCQRPTDTVVAVEAPMMSPDPQAQLAHLQARLVRLQAAQARLASWQEAMTQRDMERAQVAIENGRIEVLSGRAQVRVALPEIPRVQVNVPQVPWVQGDQLR